jgi:acetyl-CoA C-acetyltransferase
MIQTAENLASRFSISREEQDRFSAESQARATKAIESGWFKDEIVPVVLEKKGKPVGAFEKDEYPRASTTVESLAALRPILKADGTVTAGNASGINDGSAMVVLLSESALKRSGIKPLAEILGWASAGVEPEIMGIGPVGAVRNLCRKINLNAADFDLIEANEAFAVQSLAVGKELELDPAKVNICGGAIALGHPIGASGARVLVTLVHQLRRVKKKLGLATLCVGGGQGIALAVRALE